MEEVGIIKTQNPMQQKFSYLRRGYKLTSAGIWGGGCSEAGSANGKTLNWAQLQLQEGIATAGSEEVLLG